MSTPAGQTGPPSEDIAAGMPPQQHAARTAADEEAAVHLLAGEVPPAQGDGLAGGRKFRNLAFLVVVAAVAAAAFLGSRVLRQSDGELVEAQEANVIEDDGAEPVNDIHAAEQDGGPDGDDGAPSSETKGKLVIEQDLSRHVPHELLSGALHGVDHDTEPQDLASSLFDHVLSASKLREELTEREATAFHKRFVAAMINEKLTYGDADKYSRKAGVALEGSKPVMTEALAGAINVRQNNFAVEMRDWMVQVSWDVFHTRLGRAPMPRGMSSDDRVFRHKLASPVRGGDRDVLPDSFDSRERWAACKDVIGKIHNQGSCGSCWVFGALGPLDSRMCIHNTMSNTPYNSSLAALSRGFGASCVPESDGCGGGWEYFVYEHIGNKGGLPTTSCVPYFGGEDYADHWTSSMPAPACPSECDPRYTRDLEADMFRPMGVEKYTLVLDPDDEGIESMKRAMYEGGPVAFGIMADSAFMGYTRGIFDGNCAENANHAVHAIGWGVEDGCDSTQKDCRYLLAQNSWGEDWGLAGRFKIAYCVPTDFTVPGEITSDPSEFPLPIPAGMRATTTTSPPPVESTMPCVTHDDGCVTSPNWPENYGEMQTCTIGHTIGKIRVDSFHTEAGYDFLSVNDQKYSGTMGPEGVVPHTNLVWHSDFSTTRKGWKICPDGN